MRRVATNGLKEASTDTVLGAGALFHLIDGGRAYAKMQALIDSSDSGTIAIYKVVSRSEESYV